MDVTFKINYKEFENETWVLVEVLRQDLHVLRFQFHGNDLEYLRERVKNVVDVFMNI